MKIKSFLIAVLFIGLSLPAVYRIITPGYFPVHDDTQVARVDQMYKALSAGQFPVRWVPDLGYGYGYPIFNFYNPLPYYFGALFMFLGLNALAAAKIMFIFPVIGSALGMYVFAKAILRSDLAVARSDLFTMTAFLAAILYVYTPYHAVQIYVRGAVAEYWAYAILPLVFYAIWENKIILGGISLAALIISHNLTAFMSILFISLLILIKFFEVKNKLLFTIRCSLFTALALGASAFFWLPAVFEENKTQVSQMVFEKFDPPALHLIKPLQLWTGQWGYGGSSPGTDDGLSLQLGKAHLLGSTIAIILLGIKIYKGYKNNNQIQFISYSTAGLIISLFLILPFSSFIWNSFSVLSYIQFPWRFLTFASLFSSILAAWAVWKVIKIINDIKNIKLLRPPLLITFYSLLITFYSTKFFQPQFKYPVSAGELTSDERVIWEVSGRSDEYLPKGFIRPTTLEETLRVDNPINKTLVDELKKPTLIRTIANSISIITFVIIIPVSFKRKWT